MLNKDQNQDVANGATAIQAGGSVNIVNIVNNVEGGITALEAKQIALDVSKATFHELTGTAKETARLRVEEITDIVIKKIVNDFPEGLRKAKDPDFQYALLTVQKEYARNGDRDLGNLLVDLLVDRSKQVQRDILQIVLNESLSTVPKLTDTHLAALAVIFLIKYTQIHHINNHKMLDDYLDKFIFPFVQKLSKNHAGYQHMEFSGCGSIVIQSFGIEYHFGKNYQGLFLRGFDHAEITRRSVSIGLDSRFFIPCINDNTKLQVNALNKEVLNRRLEEEGLSTEDRANIIELFDLGKISDVEIKEKLIASRPYMAELFDVWTNSPMKSFTLTTVGIAIGHANIKRLNGEFADLSIWIN